VNQFLPLKKAALVLDSIKLTKDVGPEMRFCLGKEEAAWFYTAPKELVNGSNTVGLGWSPHRFNQVSWGALESALRAKPDMLQVWLSKQCIGICATRKNMAHIQDILEDKCPNRLQPQETSQHLNRCPDQGCTLLFKDNISMLSTWMHENDRTDPELAYWIEKYLLFQVTRSFSTLVESGGPAPPHIRAAAASQDLCGWVEFLHEKVSVEFWTIQDTHCALSSCFTMGEDSMKVFVLHLFQMSYSQWIFCNFTLQH
jgi:hypothetical protein